MNANSSMAGGATSGMNWGAIAKYAPQIGSMLGGAMDNNANSQSDTPSFIPMQNSQIQSAGMVKPVFDKGVIPRKKLYDYLMEQNNDERI